MERADDVPCVRADDPADPALRHFAHLRDAVLRQEGLFFAEGGKVIDRALDAGFAPVAMFLEEGWRAKAAGQVRRFAASGAVAFAAPREVFCAVTGYETIRGPVAVFARKQLPAAEDVLRGARRVAVLEELGNATNVGAVFRSAAALGIDAVLVTPSCHDPLFRRCARVSMGTVFQVPWTRISGTRDWAAEGLPVLHGAGFTVAALALRDDCVPLDRAGLAGVERLALVLGAEGDGLLPQTIAACDLAVRIPMAAAVDSLNVAAASAVAFWEARPRG